MIAYVVAGVVLLVLVAYQAATPERRRRSEAPYSPTPDGFDASSLPSPEEDADGHHHHHDGHHGDHQGDDQSGDLGGHHGGDFDSHHGGDLGGTDFGGTDFGGHH